MTFMCPFSDLCIWICLHGPTKSCCSHNRCADAKRPQKVLMTLRQNKRSDTVMGCNVD